MCHHDVYRYQLTHITTASSLLRHPYTPIGSCLISTCMLAGMLYWLCASDPRSVLPDRLKRRQQAAAVGGVTTLHSMLQDVKRVVTVPSFLIIASQGVVGAPHAAKLRRSADMYQSVHL